MLRIAAALLALTVPTTAMEWEDYEALTPDLQTAYIKGAGEALEFANAHMALTDQAPMYCPGERIGTIEEFVSLSADSRRDVPVELALMLALVERWPC